MIRGDDDDDCQSEIAAPSTYEPDDESVERFEGVYGDPRDLADDEYAALRARGAALDRFIESVRERGLSPEQRKAEIEAWKKLHVTCTGDDSNFIGLEDSLHDPAPKASTGFTVTSKRCRLTKAEIAQRKRLEQIATEIKSISDGAAKGRLLKEAKELIGQHGKWLPWLATIPMPPRTAQHYMAAAA